MERGNIRRVLLNGQGGFCDDYPNRTHGEEIPQGHFTMQVSQEQYMLLKRAGFHMLASGELCRPHPEGNISGTESCKETPRDENG
jgi:hypothetical protein